MTISKAKRRISLIFILLILICVPAVILCSFDRVDASVSVTTSAEIAEEYAFGDVLAVPECTFTVEGQSAKGSASVEFPDGSLSDEKEVSLTQNGNYAVKYIATVNGRVYTKEYAFKVLGKLANYSSSKTSIEYGLCTNLGANTEGLMVKIANGDALSFNHVFDMKNMSMTDKLLEGFVVPEQHGTVDFTKMVFTFTDVEDPSVQLVFHGNYYADPNAYGLTWFTAAGNGQIHCGLEHVGKLHVGTMQGCMVPHSFMAMDTGLYWGHLPATPVAPDAKTFCISYDAQRNQAWAGGKIVSDLDDSNYYDKLWFGFPSGKAKLTISALNYNGPTANMCFTSIFGVDLSAEIFVDGEAPEITVDCDYDVMPKAVVGGTYPVPSATAVDAVDGTVNVRASVWHNYGTEDATMVGITDGRFAVSSVGTYAIVYEAADFNGNTQREVLWVKAYLSQYIEKLAVSLEDFNQTVELGELQTLPKATVTGGCGNSTVVYTITQGSEECEISNGTYRLEKAGAWVLTCVATDYVGNVAVVAKNITGVTSGRPIIAEEPVLAKAFVSGSTYVVPTVYAYDYTSGERVEKVCSVSVEYAGSSNTYQAGETFVPTVTNDNDTVKLLFKVDGVTLLEKTVPVRIVFSKERIPGNTERYRDVVDVSRYFVTEGGISFEKGYEINAVKGLLLSASEDSQRAVVSFINPQVANLFSIDLFTVPNAGKFSAMKLRLTDSANPEIQVEVQLVKGDGQTVLRVGSTEMLLDMDFDGSVATNYNLGYKDGNLVVNYSTLVEIDKCVNGKAFDGFTSGKILFDIEMQDVKEGASLFISDICKVKVNNNQDTTGPAIVVDGIKQTSGVKDSKYTVNKVYVGDVLCPYSSALLTVTSPSGAIVTDVNGKALDGVDATVDYVISLTEYGTYHVSVRATEESSWKYSNNAFEEYAVSVVDGEKPTITFESDFTTQIKVGENLIIPNYTVADNYSAVEEIEVMIVVTNPKGMPIYIYGDTNAVTCKYAGVYNVKIFVLDQTGNLTTYEVDVTVS